MIGDKGCEWLSKSNWPCLIELGLESNKIGFEGVKHLGNANWPLL
jgi:hypothetical protein